ncbi:hypothetical protein A2U01_0062804, partial [Trifolium medium]|nr:hypothetical protein [Trifolium medium]
MELDGKKITSTSSTNSNDLASEETDVDLTNANTEENGANDDDQIENNEPPSEDESEQEANDYETEEELPPRPKRRHGYLSDYVTGLSEEEQDQLNNLALFSINGDPTTY